jgi:hypothetical protein
LPETVEELCGTWIGGPDRYRIGLRDQGCTFQERTTAELALAKRLKTMPSNKNQHFVPQFYLRNFSADTSRNSINLVNIDREKLIFGASIKGQCSRDYWHTKTNSTFEDRMREIEGTVSEIIRRCTDENKIIAVRTLMTFIMLQLGRTVSAAEAYADLMSALTNIAGVDINRTKLDPRATLELHIELAPIILDLRPCLVVNHTGTEFITSDHPVVMANWWFDHHYKRT